MSENKHVSLDKYSESECHKSGEGYYSTTLRPAFLISKHQPKSRKSRSLRTCSAF